jgi:hypothetical protein
MAIIQGEGRCGEPSARKVTFPCRNTTKAIWYPARHPKHTTRCELPCLLPRPQSCDTGRLAKYCGVNLLIQTQGIYFVNFLTVSGAIQIWSSALSPVPACSAETRRRLLNDRGSRWLQLFCTDYMQNAHHAVTMLFRPSITSKGQCTRRRRVEAGQPLSQ